MDKKQEAFLLELLNDFRIEAVEHHQAIVNGLIELEKNPPSGDYNQLVETTFREVHSLKGAARAVNQAEIGRFCQSIEGIFHSLKQGVVTLTQDHFDALYQAVDVLGVMLKEIDVTNKSVSASMLNQNMKRLESLMLGKMAAPPMEIPKPPPFIPGSESSDIQSGLNKIPEVTEEQRPTTEEPTDGKKRATSVKDSTKDTVRITTSKLQTLLREA